MSSYPTFIEASLISIAGQSCGTVTQLMEIDETVTPPEYNALSGNDMDYAKMVRTDLGGQNYTWDLTVRYNAGTACDGWHNFSRANPADDPTGDFCLSTGSGPDCNEGKVIVVEAQEPH